MNKMRDMSQAFADAIREAIDTSNAFADVRVTVLVEDKLTASFAIDSALGRNGICVIVGVTGFNQKASAGTAVFGSLRFDVSVFEIPSLSRETEESPTAQTVAEFIARHLHWCKPIGWEYPLLFNGVSRSDEADCVIEKMTFTTETEL